jgi:acetylornithine deacetylase
MEVVRELSGLLRHHGIKAEVLSGQLDPCPPMETNPHHPLVLQFLQILRQHKSVGVNYFCDAAILSQAGIPSIVFGPGDIAQAHTADEWISLKSLDLAQKRLLAFLRSLN